MIGGNADSPLRRATILPAWFYQRYQPFFDRFFPALGLTAMFVLTDTATGAFPNEWRAFIAVLIAVGTLIAPPAGYALFVAALAYPLYTISIYVAALAISLLVLGGLLFHRTIAAVTLVLAAPLLATAQLAPLTLFLAGLWWAEGGGALVGATTALWLKLFAGMCNISPDLTQLGIRPWNTAWLVTHFRSANSYQTVVWIVRPLTPDPQALLLHILEIVGWGLAGYGVGIVAQQIANRPRPGWRLVVSVIVGLLGLALGSLVLPMALGLRPWSMPSISVLLAFLVQCSWNGVIAIGIYALVRYLAQPIVVSAPLFRPRPTRSPARSRRRAGRSPERSAEGETERGIPSSRPPIPFREANANTNAENDEPSDIIMLDLD